MPPENILLREYGNVRRTQFESGTQCTRGNCNSLPALLPLSADKNGRDLPPRQHIAHDIRTLHAARKDKHLNPVRKITAQLALEQCKLPLERRHRHHLKADACRRGARREGPAHQCSKDLMPRCPCGNQILPREQARRTHLIFLRGIRKRRDQA